MEEHVIRIKSYYISWYNIYLSVYLSIYLSIYLPTINKGEGCEAGKGRDVKLHDVEVAGQVQDPIEPVSEAGADLVLVEDCPVAEGQLWVVTLDPVREI